ncbi:glycosyltransferase involved in cell wall biosynthesis [Algoriphagus ratkowskyi]|uniref:Glycosyltransferase n=1 Tax=Algoriphagus ratkowskyi TaxID=57028 RepID=A0A2W7QMW6_9BACT|nr:glycosyltransferase [Algoriphagus ratkowskyi]PZX49803.1 glycosyltransferase involved in cell wall biosynthesis [Algoriphagus ratkowskyi]TXD75477.1 glycosyltransferase [Algoriphagus ratkowskyi]
MSEVIFSIIIPCYNQAHFLPDALNSLINQSFGDWEAIVINDGSTDNTKEVSESYMLKETRVRLVNQSNQGLSAARNTGIAQSNGKYITFLDADDWLYLDFLEIVRSYFISDADIVITGYDHWKNNIAVQQVSKHYSSIGIDYFIYKNFSPCMTFCIKKIRIDQIGVFDQSLKSAEDWDFWIRAAKCELKIVSIPDVLAAYRYSDHSMSRDGSRMYEALKEVFLRISQHDSRINVQNQIIPQGVDISRGILAALMPCLGVMIVQGNVEAALELYRTERIAFNLKPSKKDFCKLNSYLTFRYWNSLKELELVLEEFEPRIRFFLEVIIPSKLVANRISREIFRSSKMKLNHLRYGSVAGGILNRLIR